MKVAEFKKWLDQFPDDTEVKILSALGQSDWDWFEGGNFTDTCGDQWNFVDYTNNPRITQETHPHVFGTKVLYLGDD